MEEERNRAGKLDPTLLGSAAEHYIMSRLLRMNMIPALAPTGAPAADIIVSDRSNKFFAAVQVKARTQIKRKPGWHMSEKHEKLISPHLFYCFVDFGSAENSLPKTWVVPSRVVAEIIRDSHISYMAEPGARGQERQGSKMRWFQTSYSRHLKTHGDGWLDRYEEAWERIIKGAGH